MTGGTHFVMLLLQVLLTLNFTANDVLPDIILFDEVEELAYLRSDVG